jgi:hypothetical protein
MAATHNLELRQGDDFTQILSFFEADGTTPKNLTGYQVRAQLRRWPSSPDGIDLVIDTDQLVLGGTVTISLNGATTTALRVRPYVWDLELEEPGGTVQTVLTGSVTVLAQVTHA